MIILVEGPCGSGRTHLAKSFTSVSFTLNCFKSAVSPISLFSPFFRKIGISPSLKGLSKEGKARYVARIVAGVLGFEKGIVTEFKADPPISLIFDHADASKEWSTVSLSIKDFHDYLEDLGVGDDVYLVIVAEKEKNVSNFIGTKDYEVHRCTFPEEEKAREIVERICDAFSVPEKYREILLEETLIRESLSFAENVARIFSELNEGNVPSSLILRTATALAPPIDYRSRIWHTDQNTAIVLLAFAELAKKHVAIPAKAVEEYVPAVAKKYRWYIVPPKKFSKTQIYSRLRMCQSVGFFKRAKDYGAHVVTNYVADYNMDLVRNSILSLFTSEGVRRNDPLPLGPCDLPCKERGSHLDPQKSPLCCPQTSQQKDQGPDTSDRGPVRRYRER